VAVYPAGNPDLSELVPSGGVYAPTLEDFNLPRRELAAVISTLGLNPQGVEASVAARLTQIEADVAAASGGGGGGSAPIVDVSNTANTAMGGGWALFHQTPPITCSTGVVLDYDWWVNMNSGYPQKPFQVIVSDVNALPNNNRANGIVTGVQPSGSGTPWDYARCLLKYNYVGALAAAPLYLFGRMIDYDPNPNAAYVGGGISFTVQRSGGTNFGAIRGLVWAY